MEQDQMVKDQIQEEEEEDVIIVECSVCGDEIEEEDNVLIYKYGSVKKEH